LPTRAAEAMLQRILRDLVLTFVLCLGERAIEWQIFPELHRLAGRAITDDPTRIDSMSAMIAEAIGLFLIIWLFNGTLYVVAWLVRKPLRPLVPTVVALIFLTVTFVGSLATWYSNPSLPPAAG
jgi:hypothetical protein